MGMREMGMSEMNIANQGNQGNVFSFEEDEQWTIGVETSVSEVEEAEEAEKASTTEEQVGGPVGSLVNGPVGDLTNVFSFEESENVSEGKGEGKTEQNTLAEQAEPDQPAEPDPPASLDEEEFLDFLCEEEEEGTEEARDEQENQSLSRVQVKQAERRHILSYSELSEYYAKHGGDPNRKTTFGIPTDTNPLEVVKEGNNAYMIIPDMHLWYKNIRSRKDYVGEGLEQLKFIEETIVNDPSLNNLIFAGDVFHQGFNNLDNARQFKDRFWRLKLLLESRGGNIYAVPGNHEYTYSTNNLFWLLEDDIFKTPTDIYNNGVHIVLDGYPSKKSVRPYRSLVEGDICITHTEVLPPVLKNGIVSETGRKIFTTNKCGDFTRFNVKDLFVGHMHQIAESYVAMDESGDKLRVQYLGSLGRTSVEEINDEFLERDFPIIRVKVDESGKGLYSLDHIKFELRKYKDSVVEADVLRNKAEYEAKKEFDSIRLEKVLEDPLEEFKERMNNVLCSSILDDASEGSKEGIVFSVWREVQDCINKYR